LRSINCQDRPLRTAGTDWIRMNQFDSSLYQICEIVYAFRIALTNHNQERSFINNSFMWQIPPIGIHCSALAQTFGISFTGKNGDLRSSTLENLVCYSFRSCE